MTKTKFPVEFTGDMCQAGEQFRREVYDRAQEVDPENECDWNNLAYGFFLGRQLSIEEAYAAAEWVTNEQFRW